jgi:serine/threonine-protein kinase
MRTQPADSAAPLRGFFHELIELDPGLRAARIAALDLPEESRLRLQAMLLFDEIAALGPGQRESRITDGNITAEVSDRVQAMLAADVRMPVLARATTDVIGRLRDDDEMLGRSLVGTRIGTFRLLELIGQGGSSAVFRAEREAGDGSQLVALKLLRTGLYSAAAQRRFRREQAILAQLTHPNIASLIESGVSSAGIPYIAMELVDGMPITKAADARELDVQQRLVWFSTLCRTIEAAHASLVVHRDLKPSNLLVTRAGDLRVLDFGIAKLVDDDELATRTQSIAFTPGYAAPEQFSTSPPTTAMDVYSLGVVLGELLTGRKLTGNVRASVAIAVVGAEDPPLPSGLPSRSALIGRLRGDLDAILATALAEEPVRRYRSAGALADDVERYLARKPVRAHPPSRLYTLGKFIRRHRAGFAIAATMLVGLVAGTGIVAWQARSIAREAQRAESTRDFLLRVFSAAEPAGPRLAPPTVADVVHAALGEVQHSTSLQPAVRIELIDELGGVLRKQGDMNASLKLLEENYRNAIATLGASDPTTLQAGLGLAESESEAKQTTAARPLLDELIRASRVHAGNALRARLLTTSAWLGVERFESERALAESAEAVALCAKACDERTRIATLVARGDVLASFNDEPAALPVLEQALTAQRRMFAGPHVEIADTLGMMSRAYRRIGNLDRAEALARESLAIIESSLPDPHQRRSNALDALRQVLIDSRKFDEAVVLGQRITKMDETLFGPEHTNLATDHNTLGYVYLLQGHYAEATDCFAVALAIARKIPDNERKAAIYQADFGYAIGLGSDPARGMGLIGEAVTRFRAQRDIDYSELSSALEKLGELQRTSGDLDVALATYENSDLVYREHLTTAPREWHARTLLGLGRTLAERGEDVRAERILRDAIDHIGTPPARLSVMRVEARVVLAEILNRRGETTDAMRMLGDASREGDLAQGTLPASLQALLQDARSAIKPVSMPRKPDERVSSTPHNRSKGSS